MSPLVIGLIIAIVSCHTEGQDTLALPQELMRDFGLLDYFYKPPYNYYSPYNHDHHDSHHGGYGRPKPNRPYHHQHHGSHSGSGSEEHYYHGYGH